MSTLLTFHHNTLLLEEEVHARGFASVTWSILLRPNVVELEAK
jgi:hypothetical protein